MRLRPFRNYIVWEEKKWNAIWTLIYNTFVLYRFCNKIEGQQMIIPADVVNYAKQYLLNLIFKFCTHNYF